MGRCLVCLLSPFYLFDLQFKRKKETEATCLRVKLSKNKIFEDITAADPII